MRIIAFILLFFSLHGVAQKSAAITEYINTYQHLAIEEQIRTGIPAAITMAQAIHESGFGVGELALKSNNHFGIKCKNTWMGERVFHDDDESGECFRSYSTVIESYRDHSDFLKNSKRYSFLFDLNPADYVGWAKGLKQAGYATNPKYPQILIKIIEENNLTELTTAALERADSGDVWVQTSNKEVVAENKTETNKTEVLTLPVKSVRSESVKEESQKKNAKQPIFKINGCKVITAEKGATLNSIANLYGIKLNDLLEFNDMKAKDKLKENQLVFLEEKKKKGANKTHIVQKNETAWSISQAEGIKLEKLQAYNYLKAGAKLKAGQTLYLKNKAPK